MQITITSDTITPDLRARVAALRDRTPIHQAIALALVSMGKRAFNDASLRPRAWKPRKDRTKTHQLLKLTGTLWRSLRPTWTNYSASVASDRKYAAVHQLGGKHMPARPFFPFVGGKATPVARQRIKAVIKAKLR